METQFRQAVQSFGVDPSMREERKTIGDAFLMTIDIYIQALELGSIEQVQDKVVLLKTMNWAALKIGYWVFKGLGYEVFEPKHCTTALEVSNKSLFMYVQHIIQTMKYQIMSQYRPSSRYS